MLKVRTARLSVAVLAVAAIIVVAGSVAIASNMGFKLNFAIQPTASLINAIGDNWTSIPYHNPYGTMGGLCSQIGLQSVIPRARVTKVDQSTNAATNGDCGTAAANSIPLPLDGSAVRIRQRGVCSNSATTFCNAPAVGCVSPGTCVATSVIIVGSHDPVLPVAPKKFCAGGTGAPPAGCPALGTCGAGIACGTGEFWFEVPYHTTAVTMADLCLSAGLTSTIPRTRLTRVRALDGVAVNGDCGTAAAAAVNLVLGEGVRIHETNANKTPFVPAHF